MKINFLKAGSGDSIIIQHKHYNIVVDGGNDKVELIYEIEKIHKSGNSIDLLVITHHDDDHIKGIIDLLNHIINNKYDKNFIKKVIFNSPRKILDKLPEAQDQSLSYKQAFNLENLLLTRQIEWEKCVDNEFTLEFDDLYIDIFPPVNSDILNYSNQNGAYLTGDHRCDWKSEMSKLDTFIDDRSLDMSISNKTSIVIEARYKDKNLLLTGDITPDRLEQIIDKKLKKNEVAFLKYDIIKLPHHGSYRSLTKSIIEKIRCKVFYISTNSRKYYLPNKRALLKILKFSCKSKEATEFIFNYDEAIYNLGITKKELEDYNFKLESNKIFIWD